MRCMVWGRPLLSPRYGHFEPGSRRVPSSTPYTLSTWLARFFPSPSFCFSYRILPLLITSSLSPLFVVITHTSLYQQTCVGWITSRMLRSFLSAIYFLLYSVSFSSSLKITFVTYVTYISVPYYLSTYVFSSSHVETRGLPSLQLRVVLSLRRACQERVCSTTIQKFRQVRAIHGQCCRS